jgi:hypothetical protein
MLLNWCITFHLISGQLAAPYLGEQESLQILDMPETMPSLKCSQKHLISSRLIIILIIATGHISPSTTPSPATFLTTHPQIPSFISILPPAPNDEIIAHSNQLAVMSPT